MGYRSGSAVQTGAATRRARSGLRWRRGGTLRNAGGGEGDNLVTDALELPTGLGLDAGNIAGVLQKACGEDVYNL